MNYFQSLDTTLGAKALGPEKTISGKMQETFASATQQARAVDEQRGISKTATDVRTLPPSLSLTSLNLRILVSPPSSVGATPAVLLSRALVAVRTEGQGVLHHNV